MNPPDDTALLRRFVDNHDEAAFGLLVRQHLPLVHAAASRQLGGDAHLADDVAQAVFSLLAKKALHLRDHPSLAGWLFTATRHAASAARRSTIRRQQREQEAAIMDEPRVTDGTEISWDKLRPVLDHALAKLGAAEREGILLRFFEGQSYAEIARKLGTRENTARMRVERAVEKLRAVLSRHGVTSTTAALGAVLTTQAAPALSEALAAQIASGALAAGAGGASAGLLGIFEFMSKLKIAVAVSMVAVGVAVFEGNAARTQAQRATELAHQTAMLRAELAEQRAALAEARARTQAADEDNGRLLGAISHAQESLGTLAKHEATSYTVSRTEALQRFQRATNLAQAKNYPEALKEYLWCFDVGMRGFGFFDYRFSEIPTALAKLGESYPPALDAIRQRRDDAVARMKADERDFDAVFDFANLSKGLKEPRAVVDAMNAFPPGDPRRDSLLTNGGYDALLADRSYAVAAAAKPYEKMVHDMDYMVAIPNAGTFTAEQLRNMRESLVKSTATNFEVLLGAGDLAHARALAAKLLAYDGSSATHAALAERAARAGSPDWKSP